MISRLLLTTFLITNLYSQTSLASAVIDEANIDRGESFNRVPTEVIKAHFIPYVLKTTLLLNRGFYWLITGYQAHENGLLNTQPSKRVPPISWKLKRGFKPYYKECTPENISPFLWFHLLRHTQGLSDDFWPYLQGTNVHTINLDYALLGNEGARNFAQSLQGTKIHTVDLGGNQIGSVTKNFLLEHYNHITWVF